MLHAEIGLAHAKIYLAIACGSTPLVRQIFMATHVSVEGFENAGGQARRLECGAICPPGMFSLMGLKNIGRRDLCVKITQDLMTPSFFSK